VILFTIILGGCITNVSAESGTPWILLKSTETFNEGSSNVGKGTHYVTIKLVHSRINHKVSWWSHFVGNNKHAIISYELDAMSKNGSFQDRRTSTPIEIRKRNEPIDLPWGTYIVTNLPTTFNRLKLQVNVGVSAEDGVDKLLDASAVISGKVPGLTMSQTVLGSVTAAKMIADFLFDKRLVTPQINSSGEIVSSGATVLKEGFYGVLSADTAGGYSQYLDNPELLFWTGQVLQYNGNPINDVSYYIIKINYSREIFDDKFNGPLSEKKPWRDLYSLARQSTEKLELDNWAKGRDQIKGQVQNANAILDKDLDLINSEKDAIHKTIKEKIIEDMQHRRKRLESDDDYLGEDDPQFLYDIGP